MIKEYFLWNWGLILILLAFAISLKETIFLDRKTIRRMYSLIITIFLLSIVVFIEFYLSGMGMYKGVRLVLMAIRYSTTPFIIASVIYTLAKGFRWFIYIPALVMAVINFISIFTGIVFRINDDNTLGRGPLGYFPFIVAGAYCVFMIYILVKRSNRQRLEIIPIAFLGFAFASGLVLPFIYGSAYSQIFCSTIAIALYVYYVFSILMMTKKDALTGLLNRQAFYSNVENDPGSISAMISIDMNGLKAINDGGGHAAGDEALITLSNCFMSVLKGRQQCYRLGGDEFVCVCRQTSKDELVRLVENVRQNVAKTKYSCAIGYSHIEDGAESVDDLLRISDQMMYEDKSRYYKASGKDRRKRSLPETETKDGFAHPGE